MSNQAGGLVPRARRRLVAICLQWWHGWYLCVRPPASELLWNLQLESLGAKLSGLSLSLSSIFKPGQQNFTEAELGKSSSL